ncbi:MAG: molybdopterin molybdotransferase MoeA [Sandaracinaceae bacterium]|nr:molybdopterin molybdotransferase MoeA [Sandaracinaceae bacterium]
MLELRDACALVTERAAALPAERVPLDEALGRYLAAPIDARRDDPAFDNSAMDGWAVRAEDTTGAGPDSPVTLRVVGESRAGVAAGVALAAGQTIRIFTGAMLPDGADAVVMQEDTRRDSDAVEILEAAHPGKHVRRRAEVVREGQPLLPAGLEIRAGEIAVAASQGHAVLTVHRRPRVAILSTGDELRDLGAPLSAESIYDSNTHAIAAAVREAGGVPQILPLGADTQPRLDALVADGLRADVLLTTGGVSVGDYDLVHGAFAAAGIEEVFWKVKIKPGKPVRFGVGPNGVLALGLPGNPVSAMVTFEVFVRPALRRMLGDPLPHRPLLRVRLARPLTAPATRTELYRARLEGDVAHPAATGSSADLSSLVGVDAFVILPAGTGPLEGADALDVRGGRGVATSPWEA